MIRNQQSPRAWFEFDKVDGTTPMLSELSGPVPLLQYKFIYHRSKAKSGLPIRGGVIRPCVWMWLFKNFGFKDWVVFAEAYGQPIRIGKYGPGASQNDKDVLLRAVSQLASDAAAIIPESMTIEFVEAQNKAGSSDVFDRIIDKCDAQMSKAVLGQTMTTDDGSSRSQAEVHNEVRTDIERADAKQLAASLNRDLVKAIIDLNYGPQKAYPRIKIGRSENVVIKDVAEATEKVVNLGGRVSKSKIVTMLGLPEPDSDDDVLAPGQVAAPPSNPDGKETAGQHHCAVCAASQQGPDAIDEAADQAAQDYERIMDPLIAELEDLFHNSTSFEEASQRLLEVADKFKMKGIAEKIARANFTARAAGNLNVDPGAGE